MKMKRWLHAYLSLVLVRALVLTAYAQDAVIPSVGAQPGLSVKASAARSRFGAGRGYTGFQSRLERTVGLTPEQRDTVHGLLAQQHQELQTLRDSMAPKYSAIQEDTDAKIRALLTPDQQKKFDAFLAQQKQARSARYHRAS